ncbi:tetratricopeptide repeat protein [Desulfofundulus thermosubterraneus]|uniref:tetratricopeptide repeat protein n=1 Tax=Desulfofundulus thermosubterraneus TaxID=348840 RepID=UPI001041E6F2|nr:tetratricopeptide repeat protein [Desulfofundulus thermosubterraneus]
MTKTRPVRNQSRPAILVTASITAAMVFLFAFFLASANSYARQATEYLQQGNVQQGLAAMQKAAAYSPLNADYHTVLMRIYLSMGRPRQALEEARRAAALSRYSAGRQADLARASLAAGRYTDAVAYARRAVELAPYQIAWYETLAATCAAAGRGELQASNRDAARRHLEEALKVPEMIQARVAGLGEEEKKLWVDAPMLSVTPGVHLGMGQARYLLGDLPGAEKSLQAAMQDNQLKGEASLWLALVREKQGKTEEAKKLVKEAGQINKSLEAIFQQLKAVPALQG